ncbi:MAG TPA: glycosyltransferase [Marmoricola sp.]|nr:glycosyltransferase [Marmoricola sp.]
MHVLMVLWDGGGTVPVEVGAARRLIEAGHSVTVLGEPSVGGAAAAVGARFRPWQRAPYPVQERIADWEVTNPLTLLRRLLDGLFTGPSAALAADVRAAAEAEPVDAVVADVALMGALVAAESLGIPSAALIPGPYLRPTPGEPPFGSGLSPATGPLGQLRDQVLPRVANRLTDLGLRQLNATRHELGLEALDHVWSQLDRTDRVLVLTAEAFDFPAGDRPANVRYVGPILDDPEWAGDAVPLPPGDDPLVLVGLSTARTRGAPELLERVVAGLAGCQVRALVTTGPALRPVAAPRPGIQLVPSVPHSRVLPHVSLVVTHGGHGTVIKALAADRPVLVLPLGRDQPDNAARVVRHHAGARLRPTATPERIGRAVSELLTDPSYAEGAARLGRLIRAAGVGDRFVAEVTGMVTGAR